MCVCGCVCVSVRGMCVMFVCGVHVCVHGVWCVCGVWYVSAWYMCVWCVWCRVCNRYQVIWVIRIFTKTYPFE